MNSASPRLFFDFTRLSSPSQIQAVCGSVAEKPCEAESLRDPTQSS